LLPLPPMPLLHQQQPLPLEHQHSTTSNAPSQASIEAEFQRKKTPYVHEL